MPAPKTAPASGLPSRLAWGHNGRRINIPKLAGELEALLGIRLMARVAADTVHGHISTIRKPAGQPFAVRTSVDPATGERLGEEVDACPFCEAAQPRDQVHDCPEVILYEQSEAPNAEHRATLAAHGLSAAQFDALRLTCEAHIP